MAEGSAILVSVVLLEDCWMELMRWCVVEKKLYLGCILYQSEAVAQAHVVPPI